MTYVGEIKVRSLGNITELWGASVFCAHGWPFWKGVNSDGSRAEEDELEVKQIMPEGGLGRGSQLWWFSLRRPSGGCSEGKKLTLNYIRLCAKPSAVHFTYVIKPYIPQHSSLFLYF